MYFVLFIFEAKLKSADRAKTPECPGILTLSGRSSLAQDYLARPCIIYSVGESCWSATTALSRRQSSFSEANLPNVTMYLVPGRTPCMYCVSQDKNAI